MGIISTIKSVLGMGDSGRAGETNVSVEREPDAATERAVKEDPAAEPDEPGAGADEAGAEAEPEPEPDEGESVETIKGIGPAYADRLTDAGIRTVAQLADADAAAIAAETDLSEGRIETWIERAREH